MDSNSEQVRKFVQQYISDYIKSEGSTCWFCGKNIEILGKNTKQSCVSFPMHKKISSTKVSPTKRVKKWQELNIFIPGCNSCKRRFIGINLVSFLIVIIIALVPITAIILKQDYLLVLLLPLFIFSSIFTQLFIRLYTNLIQIGFKHKVGDYFMITKLKKEGWEYSYQTG